MWKEMQWIKRGIAGFEKRPFKSTERASSIFLTQVHGNRVINLSRPPKELEKADGMITQTSNLMLCIRHADCQAAFFVDPLRKVIGACHAGWRGLVGNIYHEMVDAMRRHYDTNPQDLLVYISPSLCPQHSEFRGYRDYFPPSFHSFQVAENHFDLKAIARFQLESAGLLSTSIQLSKACTYCDSKYHSYRRNKEDKERQISWIYKTDHSK